MLLLISPPAWAAPSPAPANAAVTAAAERIVRHQVADGAIVMGNAAVTNGWLVPYFVLAGNAGARFRRSGCGY